MAHLRSKRGCAWDRAQTHKTLLKYLREESREVERAVQKKDWGNLKEELGDLLLQILFHAKIAQEKRRFGFRDVLRTLEKKLINRHPHVFGPRRENLTPNEVLRRWKKLKRTL